MSLEQLLGELLAEPLDRVEARSSGEFDRIAAPFQDRVVIFGTGYLGRLALSGLRAAGIEPIAFCDNNARLWTTPVEGVPVLSPAEAVERYRDSAAFVVAIYNSAAPRNQLVDLGCHRIVP
jgi:FlaA1/EpsC-like NDP-sugar epimerase